MTGGFESAAARAGAQRQRRVIARGAAVLREILPSARITAESDAIVIEGRGLARRFADDPRLRWIGGLIR